MSSVDLLEDLQRRIISKDLICTLELEATTPILIGGYDAKTYHKNLNELEKLRPSSVKGIWRWWARSFIAAAIYERMGGFPNIRDADKIISELLGSVGDSAHCSLYQLFVENLDVKPLDISPDRLKIARIKLTDKALLRGSKFAVRLCRYGETTDIQDRFITYTLMLALTLGGVGKATSRGFGKLVVSHANLQDRNLQEIYKKLRNLHAEEVINKPSEVERVTKELLRIGVDLAAKLLESKQLEKIHLNKKPLFETPVDGYYKVIVPKKSFNQDYTALEAIGNASLKLYWKAYHLIKQKNLPMQKALSEARRILGLEYNTWILGLPRLQKSTGYFISQRGRKIRRKSPIIFTLIKPLRRDSPYYILVLGFKTYDWEALKMIHKGKYGENAVKINVDAVFEESMDCIRGIIERLHS